MIVDNKKILVTSRGSNKHVINTIVDVLRSNLGSCVDIVRDIRSLDVYSQCYSIFSYVLDNVRYIEDAGNNQYIKTPSRTLADGYADCKSMAILICCCLKALNIPCELRFVDFVGNGIYTHVYAVAYNNNEPIIIDPVERVNGQPQFNYASNFVNKLTYSV